MHSKSSEKAKAFQIISGFSLFLVYFSFLLINFSLLQIGIIGYVLIFIIDAMTFALIIKQKKDRLSIEDTMEDIIHGKMSSRISSFSLKLDNKRLAEKVNLLGESVKEAVDKSIKDEKLKAELVANVSHDLKTPLTSIINYADLLKRENIENEKAKEYICILDNKAQRLKQLIEDLLEISKINSGNVTVNLIEIDLVEFINQILGEFGDKFENAGLNVRFDSDRQRMFVIADPRHLCRVMENLIGNICKYALKGTFVTIDISDTPERDKIRLLIRNISSAPINFTSDELTERFVRGDKARHDNGFGLGLSIAQNLTSLMGAEFKVHTSGDLFKTTIGFLLK